MTRTLAHRTARILLLASCALFFISPATRAADDPIPRQVQVAVDRGLAWLAQKQDHDGAWQAGTLSGGPVAAVTSLSAMAFMARGHVPGQGPYGDNLNRAIDSVIALQRPDGLLADRTEAQQAMYDHGISTVMLCEVFGMLDEQRQPLAKKAIGRAVRLILAAQAIPKSENDRGGWRYTPDTSSSDLSVTGWQLMALRGAANVGANLPPRAIASGIEYVKRRANADGGFSYTASDGGNAARTGTGILSLVLLGQFDAPEVKAGGDFLIRSLGAHEIFDPTHYFYTVYYVSQASYQLGGVYWETINPVLRDALLQSQSKDGSWSSANTGEQVGGDSYSTAMAILALTVPYRYLPIYQR